MRFERRGRFQLGWSILLIWFLCVSVFLAGCSSQGSINGNLEVTEIFDAQEEVPKEKVSTKDSITNLWRTDYEQISEEEYNHK